MSTARNAAFGIVLGFAAVSCSSNPSSGTTDNGAGSDAGGAVPTNAVSTVTGSVAVPATFNGDPAKIIFGWGDKQIVDATGKLLNAPQEFLPSLSGIPNPTIVAGQPYALDLTGLDIPFGDHYVLVAIYVKGTSGTIPEKDKDYVAGTTTTVSFTGSKVTLPALTFVPAAGM